MYRIIIVVLLLTAAASISPAADMLPRDRQREIIDNYLFVTGKRDRIPSQALAEQDPNHPWPHTVKCGMSAVADLVLNRDRINRELLSEAGIQIDVRPALSYQYSSPSGRFLVHYDITGSNAVYQPTRVDGNGVPLYVKSVGDIADSVYDFIIDTLQYPAPPSDSFYDPEGGQFDIYLLNLNAGVYGLSYIDSAQIDGPGTIRATSYMELDATYGGLPQYANRPLDAVRVTMAHEYFHSVQFGIDFTEAPIYNDNFVARYWMEMSAVWMEEQAYSQINDYYNYLPFFFNDPRNSIQQFSSYADPRPYAAGIFAMYLSDVYGRDIIRQIWLRCGQYGAGPNFLKPDTLATTPPSAAAVVIDSMSNHTATFATAYRDFTLWNWFTGPRANLAPPGFGWPKEERDTFPAFPDSVLDVVQNYPILRVGSNNPYSPLHNGATFIRLNDMNLVTYDTGYYDCNEYYDSTCTDSIQVLDTLLGYDFLHVDSTLHDTTYWNCAVYSDSVCGDSVQVASTDAWDFIHVRSRAVGYDTTYWQCTGLVDRRCIDSTEVTDTTLGYDFMYADTILDLYLGLGLGATVPPLVEPWGVSLIYQFASNPDSVELDTVLLPDKFVTHLGIPDPHQYKSIVVALSPATYMGTTDYYEPFPLRLPMAVAYSVEVQIDASRYFNLPSGVLAPYPNPAVVSQMQGHPVTFRFQVQTDSAGVAIYDPSNGSIPYLVVDIYTVAGERVRTVSGSPTTIERGLYELPWDMRNQHGKDVASGVYLVYARLYRNANKEMLLADDRTKVVIIR